MNYSFKLLKLAQNLISSESKKYFYIGNCTDSFDADSGECVTELGYTDVTQFAQSEEQAKEITKEKFLEVVPKDHLLEIIQDHNISNDLVYLYDRDNDVYMLYDNNKDIHYFFK